MVAQAVATIALGLLGASGISKLIDPDPTAGAMRAARLPASRLTSRLLGTIELVVAFWALTTGALLATTFAALLYLAFAAFTITVLGNRTPLQSCGCFGREDTPPTVVHVVYNLVAAAGLAGLVIIDRDPVDWAMSSTDLALYGTFVAIGVFASYLAMTRLPQLIALVRTP